MAAMGGTGLSGGMISNRKRRVTWLLDGALREARRLAGDEQLCRVALALYDPATEIVSSFVHSGEPNHVLDRYECLLRETPGLAAIARDGRPRVIEDISVLSAGHDDHTAALRGAGFRSSLTMAMMPGGVLTGFMFFNARTTGLFTAEVVERLEAFLADLPRFLLRELEREF
jgi:hypothetical protein